MWDMNESVVDRFEWEIEICVGNLPSPPDRGEIKKACARVEGEEG